MVFGLAWCARLIFIFTCSINPLQSPDSPIYISIARGILQTGDLNRTINSELQEITDRMPGYPYFLAILFFCFGECFFKIRIIQIFIDSFACLLVASISECLKKGTFLTSGILAALNLNLIIHSAEILTDSIFLFCLLIFLLSSFKILKNSKDHVKNISAAFLALAISIFIRPVAIYFYFLVFFLICIFLFFRKKSLFYLIPAIIPLLLILSYCFGNYKKYNKFSLTSQTGYALAEWYVPLTFQYARGISPEVTKKEIIANKNILDETVKFKKDINPFFESSYLTKVSFQKLRELSFFELNIGWNSGCFLNFFIPNVSSLPKLINMERPRFFSHEGKNLLDKIYKFSKNNFKNNYFLAISFGFIITLITRALFLIGLTNFLISKNESIFLKTFTISYILYFLVVTGPLVSGARYRLPIEPFLIIFTAIGIHNVLFKKHSIK